MNKIYDYDNPNTQRAEQQKKTTFWFLVVADEWWLWRSYIFYILYNVPLREN